MQKSRIHKYLAWLLVFAIVFSASGIENSTEVIAKNKKATVAKSVSLKIGSKKVAKKTYKMKRGESKKIKVSVSPKKGKKTIKFKSDNKKVATVNSKGRVLTKKVGIAKIMVTVRLRKAGKNRVSIKKSTWVKIEVVSPRNSDKTSDNSEIESSTIENTTEAESSTVQNPAETESPTIENPSEKKSIVIYFSCTDNTKNIAEYVAESASADIYRIEPLIPYISADLNYGNTESRTSKEQNDSSARPEIVGELPSLDQYEKVYLGYPIWWGQAPKIMYTFIEHNNLSGKTVIPFCTSASSGIGTSAINLQAVDSSHTTWLNGRRFSSSTPKSEVISWVDGLGQ